MLSEPLTVITLDDNYCFEYTISSKMNDLSVQRCKNWFQIYIESGMEINTIFLKNKIRFILGIMNVDERHDMIYYHYMEDMEQEEEFDW